MCMHIHERTCTYTHSHKYPRTHTYTRTHARTHARTRARTHAHTNARIHTHPHTQTYTCTHAHMHGRTSIRKLTHANMHGQIHTCTTHICTHIHMCAGRTHRVCGTTVRGYAGLKQTKKFTFQTPSSNYILSLFVILETYHDFIRGPGLFMQYYTDEDILTGDDLMFEYNPEVTSTFLLLL